MQGVMKTYLYRDIHGPTMEHNLLLELFTKKIIIKLNSNQDEYNVNPIKLFRVCKIKFPIS